MTYIYSLSLECETKEQAKLLSLYFNYLPNLSVNTHKDLEGNYWCVVIPLDEPNESLLYNYLHRAPSLYRYALIGLEVDEFRTYEELMREESLNVFPGLVIRRDISNNFTYGVEEFSESYVRVPLRSN